MTHEELRVVAKWLESLPRYTQLDIRGEGYYRLFSAVYAAGGTNAFEVLAAFMAQVEAMEGKGDG